MDYKEALSKVQSSGTENKENTLKECESKLDRAARIFNSKAYIWSIVLAFVLPLPVIFILINKSGVLSRLLGRRVGILTAIAIAFVVIGFVLLIVKACATSALKKKKSAAERSLDSETEVTGNINDECSKFYELCVSNGITELNAGNKGDFMLVAKQLGVTDPAQAKWRFERGEALRIIAVTEQADKYLERSQERSALVGKEKYKAYAKKQALMYKGFADRNKVTEATAQTLATVAKSNKPRDWGTAGALASAVLGPAAGVAVAVSIQQKNQQDAEHAANTLERTSHTIERAREKYDGHMKSCEEWNRIIARIDGLVADEDEKYFSSVEINVRDAEVTTADTMYIKLSTYIKGFPELLGKPALIDGSFTLYVCEDGRRIGSTIVCAPDFNSIECKKMGYDGAKMSALCRASQGNSFSAEKQYSFEFENVHTWAIQKW